MAEKNQPFYATWRDVLLPVEILMPFTYCFGLARRLYELIITTRIGRAIHYSALATFVAVKLAVWGGIAVLMLLVVIPVIVLALRWFLFVGLAAIAAVMRMAIILRSASSQSEGVLELLATDFGAVGPEVCGNWSTLWCTVFPGCCGG